MKGLYKILVIILIVLLSLPAIQYFTHVVKIKPLEGVYVESNPVFTFKNYINFELQKESMSYIDQNFGFRPIFIRTYNQFQYSFFNQLHGNAVVVGKEDYLFEDWFIKEYLGYHNVGKEKIEGDVMKLSKIRQFLNKYNTELLVVLAPGKSYYYPEYIPDYYVRASKYTNYGVYAELLRKSDVPTFDANGWFMKLKGHEEAPLFPKTGTHWSYYGAEIAADSIIKISEHLLNRKLNHFVIDSLEWDNTPREADKDIEGLSNLFFPINPVPHAYPVLKHDTVVSIEDQPQLITIGDSFFWQIFDNSLNKSFNPIWYWYYYNSVFPQYKYKTVKEFDVSVQIKNTDLVILLTSTAGLYKLGYGFIDEAYALALEDESHSSSSTEKTTNEEQALNK